VIRSHILPRLDIGIESDAVDSKMAAKASANATHGAHHDDRDLPGIADLQMRVEVAEDKGKLYIPILDSQEAVEVWPSARAEDTFTCCAHYGGFYGRSHV